MSGNGLAKCPYIYKEQYDVGDLITVAFSGKSAVVQILSVTEHWTWGNYNIQFSFGKPQNNLSEQLQLMLRKIQSASNKEKATESVKWYNVANVNSMSASDVTFNTIGFTGTLTANKTFTFYLDDEKTGAKSYNIYVKNLSGNFTLTLTTGRAGKTNYVLKGGVNLTGRILVDDEGNITSQSVTATSVIESGNNQPATSGGVANAIQDVIDVSSSLPTDAVLHYSFDEVPDIPDGTAVAKFLDNTYQFQSTPYLFALRNIQGATTTIENKNGNIKVSTSGAANSGVYITTSSQTTSDTWGKIIKLRINVTQVTDTLVIYDGLDNIVKSITEVGIYDIAFVHNNDSSENKAVFMVAPSSTGSWELTVEQIYIGNGSYATPIIDNANGQFNATNNGGIAVQGVSGKGVMLLKGKSIRNSNFNLSRNFAISVWVNANDTTLNLNGLLVFKQEQIVLRNGVNGNNALLLTLYDINNNAIINQDRVSDLLPAKVWTHIVISRNETTCKVYINGEVTYTKSIANNTISNNSNDFVCGGKTLERISSVDDLLIFDRALSDTEVLALYLNKANTPKYYDINNYNLKQIKDITAQSTDFSDFQSRMAGLATRSLQLIEPTEDER
jgi:hypothetical protein